MAKLINKVVANLFILLFWFEISAAIELSRKQEGLHVTVITDLKHFLEKYPDVDVHPLVKNSTTYTLGAREEGDSLAITYANCLYHPLSNQSIGLIGFADAVTTRQITTIRVEFEETTEGNVYLINGGVGERFVMLVVLAPPINSGAFLFEIYFYGKKDNLPL